MSAHAAVHDNLVIGGGLAGSMVAIRLASAGRAVTLLEKERSAHHKVCGEFLSREALDSLLQVDLDPIALGAQPIRFVRLSSKGKTSASPLPFTAFSLSRFTLDETLLARARHSGCAVERGVTVQGLTRTGDLWCAELRGREPLYARTVFLANGKHDLRGWPRLHEPTRSPGQKNDLVAFKMHWQLAPVQTEALRSFIELFLFPGGYGGLVLVEHDAANLCFVVRRSTLRAAGTWDRVLSSVLADTPLIRQRLSSAKALWDRPLALSSIPYGYLANRSSPLWCVGDQAAVIPSFTGDGMSIALHSAALAAEMYLAGESSLTYGQALKTQLNRGMSLSVGLSRAMVASATRGLVPIALALVPNVLQWIAASTRIPPPARLAGPVHTLRPRAGT